jgi:hypothetical protein
VKSLVTLITFLFLAWLSPAMATPTEKEIEKAMGERLTRTPEFTFIREEAEKLGVKVYLFGGTAASYAHYVRQDLAREAGDARYASQKFDYDYTNIFRSTQDLDVVIDGSAEQAEKLEKALKTKFPHFVGAKNNKWEVRPLREARGEKEAILGNPHFQNQHTDSHSTGMVEITKPRGGDPLVRDVRDWNSKTPQFLRDVAQQKLHYYWSPGHEQTKRFLEGKNPSIVSAIRYYTKAFQYDLDIPAEDQKKLQEIVAAFNPSTLKNDYVKDWIEKNGKKLFMHAVDLERAWNELENTGLRQKLLKLSPKVDLADSLGWWLSREPLRSDEVGKGKGKTAGEIAKELGEEKLVVSHETKGFIPYESLTRDRSGELNAFISRQNKTAEAAIHGEGFYTRIGRQGARQTGYTIRMEIDPMAREGADFERVDDYIVVKNKKAVRVIPEELQLSLLEFFQQIARTGKGWDPDDRALLEAFKRKAGRQGIASEDDIQAIKKMVKYAVINGAAGEKMNIPLLGEWLSLPQSTEDLPLAEKFLQTVQGKTYDIRGRAIAQTFAKPHWLRTPEILDILLRSPGTGYQGESALVPALVETAWREEPAAIEFIEKLLRSKEDQGALLGEVLTSEYWMNHPRHKELWGKLLSSDHSLVKAAEQLSSPKANGLMQKQMQMLRDLLKSGKADEGITTVLTHGNWDQAFKEEMMDAIVAHGNVDTKIADYLLFRTEHIPSPKYADWYFKVLERGKEDNHLTRSIQYLPEEYRTRAIETILKRGSADVGLTYVLGKLSPRKFPKVIDWMKTIAARSPEAADALIRGTFNSSDNRRGGLELVDWSKEPKAVEIVNNAAKAGGSDFPLMQLLKEREWIKRPEAGEWLRELILRNHDDMHTTIYQHGILNLPEWQTHHPDIYADIQRYGNHPAQLQQLWRQTRSPVVRPNSSGISLTINCQVQFGQIRISR